jgi:hypothetical protein
LGYDKVMMAITLFLWFLIGLFVWILVCDYCHLSKEGFQGTDTSDGKFQPYTDNDPNRLAVQNSANIDYLKSRMDDNSKTTSNLNQQVTDLSLNVIRLNQQVSGLVAQQHSMASNFNNNLNAPEPSTNPSQVPSSSLTQ